MGKIVVSLKDGVIDDVIFSNVENYKEIKDYLLVNNNRDFNIYDKIFWTVRQTDNQLVHISTGMTPDEETKDSIARLTKLHLDGQLTNAQFQAGITSLTKQNLELKKENASFKTAITKLTQEFADFKSKNTINKMEK